MVPWPPITPSTRARAQRFTGSASEALPDGAFEDSGDRGDNGDTGDSAESGDSGDVTPEAEEGAPPAGPGELAEPQPSADPSLKACLPSVSPLSTAKMMAISKTPFSTKTLMPTKPTKVPVFG